MGEQADYILNGDDCQVCGEHLGEGDGYPRTCAGCGGVPETNNRNDSKRRKRKRKKARERQKKAERLAALDSTGWRVCTPVHWQKTIHGQRLDYWPTTKKAMWQGNVYPAIDDMDAFIKWIEGATPNEHRA